MPLSFPKANSKSNDESNVIDIDIALVKEFLENRDRSAFTRLISRHQNTVYAICFRYTANRQDAEDIAQEVFIRVYKNLQNFRGESKFSSWLYRITVNTCHNYVRWNKRFRKSGMMEINNVSRGEDEGVLEMRNHGADPEKSMINKELGSLIRLSVARLKGKQKSVVILKDFFDRSYEEIANIMNMSMGSVKSTLSRGRLRVAKNLKEYDVS